MRRLLFLFAVIVEMLLDCHAQAVVKLTWTAPPSCTSAPCAYVVSRATATAGTCPATSGAAYTPLNQASPVSGTAYTDNAPAPLDCYTAKTIQGGVSSAPSAASNNGVLIAVPVVPTSIKYVAGSYADSGIKTAGSASLSVTCAGGEFVVIIAHDYYHGTTAFSSVSASGNTMVADNNLHTGWSGTGGASESYHIARCTAGATTITAKSNSPYGQTEIWAARYTGLVNRTLETAVWIASRLPSKTATCAIRPSNTGELLVGFIGTTTNQYGPVGGLATTWNLRSPVSTKGDAGTVVDKLSYPSGSNIVSLTFGVGVPWQCGIVAYR
jgi:hypothetical protein